MPARVDVMERRVLMAAGDLDPSFGGGDGIGAAADFGFVDAAEAVVVLPDGRLLVAGGGTPHPVPDGVGSGGDPSVARYRADGSLDTTFGGGDGLASVDLGGNRGEWIGSLAVRPDG